LYFSAAAIAGCHRCHQLYAPGTQMPPETDSGGRTGELTMELAMELAVEAH
jgi:hypothetical protein